MATWGYSEWTFFLLQTVIWQIHNDFLLQIKPWNHPTKLDSRYMWCLRTGKWPQRIIFPNNPYPQILQALVTPFTVTRSHSEVRYLKTFSSLTKKKGDFHNFKFFFQTCHWNSCQLVACLVNVSKYDVGSLFIMFTLVNDSCFPYMHNSIELVILVLSIMLYKWWPVLKTCISAFITYGHPFLMRHESDFLYSMFAAFLFRPFLVEDILT